ncbi:MAG: hypothetical protein RL698_3758 [Pseudomonadota bacterium]|jgi:mono/diheme cytochrome c family protein
MRRILAVAIGISVAGCATTRNAANTVGTATTGVVGAAASGSSGVVGSAVGTATGVASATAAGTAGAVGATTGAAGSSTPLPAKGTPEYLQVGRDQYVKYCATCHGPSGTGDGVASSTFNKHPVDLTQLSRQNGGTFPMAKVISIVKGDTPISAHGKREMPVWGEILGHPLDDSMYQQDAANLKILSIASYLETIQK